MRIHCTVLTLILLIGVFSNARGQSEKKLATGQQVLAGTEWRLISLGRIGAETLVSGPPSVTLKFTNDGRVNGSGDCNTYGGSFTVQGDHLTFSKVFSTKRACIDSNANRRESEYFAALESANRFRLSARHLSIYYGAGRSMLDFVNDAVDSGDTDKLENVDDPISAISAYYRAINAKDYELAYRYWETPAQTRAQFIRGFSDTTSVKLFVDPSPEIEGAAGSSYASISTVLITQRANAGERIFVGCYVMRKSNLGPEDGQFRKGWRIYKANLKAAPANLRVTTLFSKACRDED